MVSYQEKKVLIIGLGLSGQSCIDYFMAKGVIPKAIDTRKNVDGLDKLPPEVEYHLGGFCREWLEQADLIVVSPGVDPNAPELQAIRRKGTECIGDIELFCRELNHRNKGKRHAPWVVAITGSNGKTTTTSLMGDIVAATGRRVAVAGNIGQSVLSLLHEDYDAYVLELSSFQLETVNSLYADVATILNVTEDHMDRYPLGLSQYQQAKQRVYRHAKTCVYNAEDVLTHPDNQLHQQLVSFGMSHGDYQLMVVDEKTWLSSHQQPVFDVNELKLVGQHNYLNVLAVLAMADALLIPRETTCSVLRCFEGLPHRFELVYEHHGVKWIDDSKATNVGSTEAALRGLHCQGTLYLLMGGDGKAADFSPLTSYVKQPFIQLCCFGRDAQLLAALNPSQAQVFNTLESAIKSIVLRLKHGDVVLLSPACASWDQFKNYQHRGAVFAELARELG